MTSIVDEASAYARFLENHISQSSGVPIDQARKMVARRTGIPAGTLENLRRGRVKTVAAHVFAALHTAIINQLTFEIGRLTHELQIARMSSDRMDAGSVLAAEAALQAARDAIGGKS